MMIGTEMVALFYGLATAASWGAADFSGGFATKRINVYRVVIVSQFVGGLGLVGIAFLFSEPFPAVRDLVYGGLAGIAGGLGLVGLYQALAVGRMGIVAPLVAVVTTVLPVMVGILGEGLPAGQQLLGFGLALLGIWFISFSSEDQAKIRLRELSLPVLAGSGFGLFLVSIDRVSEGAILWPLVAAKVTSISLLVGVVIMMPRPKERMGFKYLPVMALAGIFDNGGNAFFVLATQTGRLDIATILASLYPAVTVCLAWFILQERLTLRQWGGGFAALLAILLISS